MEIIAHRGYWKSEDQKNTENAFKASFEKGFGIETDIRDFNGELVISHDIPNSNSLKFFEFLDLYKSNGKNLCLALNIKSDGLQKKIKIMLEKYDIKNYFLFDMSVPEQLIYLNYGFRVFTRQSELEKFCILYDESDGVWIDSFFSEWLDLETLEYHLESKKIVCIVSPELHKRNHIDLWNKLQIFRNRNDIILCTDLVDEAEDFFHVK